MNKLLKFKEFSDLLESILYESDSSTTNWEQILIDSYETMFPTNKGKWILYKGSGTKTGKREQVFRAPFGIEDAKENVKKFLTLNKIMFKDLVEVTKTDSESITSKYQSFRFTVDQETPIGTTKKLLPGVYYFIVNLEYSLKGEVVIGNTKSFTPKDLGLSGDSLFHNDQELLGGELMKELKLKIEDANTVLLIEDIIKAISIRKSPCEFDSVKVLCEPDTKLSPYSIKYKTTAKYDLIPDSTLSLIKNNIGEILGGIFMFNIIENFQTGVNFPDSASFKLVDFFFDGMGISSKAGGGAKPSGSGYTDSIVNAMEEHNWQPAIGKEKEFYDAFVVPMSKPKVLGIEEKGNQIFASTAWMLSNGFPKSSTIWNTFQKLSKASFTNNPNRSQIVSALESIKTDGNLHLLIKEINPIAKRGLSRIGNKDVGKFLKCVGRSMEDEAATLLDGFDEYTKVGIILYYSAVELSNYININWSNELDSLINRAIKYQQLYMNLDITQDTVIFDLKSMSNSKFEVGTLNNLAAWTNNQLKISMK
jgi:hypothetical protein